MKEGDWQKLNPTQGLAIALDDRRGLRFRLRVLAMKGLNLAATAAANRRPSVLWTFKPATGSVPPSTLRSSSREQELCARCHSRRGQFWEEYGFGKPLLDTHRQALLTPDLY